MRKCHKIYKTIRKSNVAAQNYTLELKKYFFCVRLNWQKLFLCLIRCQPRDKCSLMRERESSYDRGKEYKDNGTWKTLSYSYLSVPENLARVPLSHSLLAQSPFMRPALFYCDPLQGVPKPKSRPQIVQCDQSHMGKYKLSWQLSVIRDRLEVLRSTLCTCSCSSAFHSGCIT